mmetsp:Transcript_9423/g.28316  ORF Transcript_9423/g.28316 Transcript_9423/m.28316 type:complete len:224 (+) Transcript_9423:2076-2747(+)
MGMRTMGMGRRRRQVRARMVAVLSLSSPLPRPLVVSPLPQLSKAIAPRQIPSYAFQTTTRTTRLPRWPRPSPSSRSKSSCHRLRSLRPRLSATSCRKMKRMQTQKPKYPSTGLCSSPTSNFTASTSPALTTVLSWLHSKDDPSSPGGTPTASGGSGPNASLMLETLSSRSTASRFPWACPSLTYSRRCRWQYATPPTRLWPSFSGSPPSSRSSTGIWSYRGRS